MPSPRSKLSIISERTLVPVSLLTTVAGVIFWTGTIAARLEAAEKRLDASASRESALYAEFGQLHAQVAGIDAKVDILLDWARKQEKAQ
jgi:hypothetical protein